MNKLLEQLGNFKYIYAFQIRSISDDEQKKWKTNKSCVYFTKILLAPRVTNRWQRHHYQPSASFVIGTPIWQFDKTTVV